MLKKRWLKLSLERIIDALTQIGLTRMQAEIYVYLAKKGPKTIENIKKRFIYSRKKLSKILRYYN